MHPAVASDDTALPPRGRPAHRHPAPLGAGCLVSCLVAAAALLPARAAAAAPLVRLELGPALAWLDYSERGPAGDVLDRETGAVPGLAVAVELEWPAAFARLVARGGDGALHYAGQTQSANAALDGLPLSAPSDATVGALELRAGAFVGGDRRLALYGGAAVRGWRRSIRPSTATTSGGATVAVPGLTEVYRWGELQAGARWIAMRGPALELVVDVRALLTVAGSVAVDGLQLGLAPRPGGRLGLEARLPIAGAWYAALEASGAGWAFGASSVDARSGLREPDSVTWELAAEARAGVAF